METMVERPGIAVDFSALCQRIALPDYEGCRNRQFKSDFLSCNRHVLPSGLEDNFVCSASICSAGGNDCLSRKTGYLGRNGYGAQFSAYLLCCPVIEAPEVYISRDEPAGGKDQETEIHGRYYSVIRPDGFRDMSAGQKTGVFQK